MKELEVALFSAMFYGWHHGMLLFNGPLLPAVARTKAHSGSCSSLLSLRIVLTSHIIIFFFFLHRQDLITVYLSELLP